MADLKKDLKLLLLTEAVCVVALLLFALVCGRALGPLMAEPAVAGIADLHGSGRILYSLTIFIGVILYEAMCRKLIQMKKDRLPLRLAGCTLLAAAIYARFGPVAAVFGCVPGFLSAWVFSKTGRWLPVLLWQLQWQGMQVAVIIGLALAAHPEAKARFLYAYKLRNIREGKLTYLSNWGWVDASHDHAERYEILKKAVADKESRVTISESFVNIIGHWTPVEVEYQIQEPEKLSALEQWAVVSGISMDYSIRNERAQASVPVWYCSHLSAWQFDDLPSTLRTCLMHAPEHSFAPGDGITEVQQLEALWKQQGVELTRTQFDKVALPPQAPQELQNLLMEIERTKAHWTCQGSP